MDTDMSEHWGGYDPGDGPLRDEISELRAEIERLREHHKLAVDNWTLEAQTVKQQEDEIHALKAEIERLRKYTDGMRCAACDATRLELGEARAEIKHFRGLLREGCDPYCAPGWVERVREALGE